MMNLHIGMFIQIVIYPYYIVFITINHIKDSTNKEDYHKIEFGYIEINPRIHPAFLMKGQIKLLEA